MVDKRNPAYSAYYTVKMRESDRRRKQRAVDYKGGKCQKCGYSKCLNALEFHHTDPSRKDFTVAGKRRPWEDLRIELDKCLLLCSNCHREHHEALVDSEHALKLLEIRKHIPDRGSAPKKETRTCTRCSTPFETYPSTGKHFCSRSCKASAQHAVAWPSDSDLSELLRTCTKTKVAQDIGVDIKSLRYYCRLRNIT